MSHATPFSLRSLIASFSDLIRLPRAFWVIIVVYVVESLAYFGVLTLMTTFLTGDLRKPDVQPGNLAQPAALAAAITTSNDPVSVLLRQRLDSSELEAIRSAGERADATGLAPVLTGVIKRGLLYEPEVFAGVAMPTHAARPVTNLLTRARALVSAQDVYRPHQVALSLRQGSNAVARVLAERLAPATRALVDASASAAVPDPELQAALAAEFNQRITGPTLLVAGLPAESIPESVRGFVGPPLTGETRCEANRRSIEAAFPDAVATWSPPTRRAKAYLNRLLLEAAYPELLKPGRKPGLGDKAASMFVSLFTMSVTLFMLFIGSSAEKLGLRRALVLGMVICIVGRGLYSFAPAFLDPWLIPAIALSLIITAAGAAITTPVSYSGVRQYTDEKTNSMGYGLIYAIMNLGIVGMGTLSAWMRPGVQDLKDGRVPEAEASSFLSWVASWTGSGVQAVNWATTALTVLATGLLLVFLTKKTQAQRLRPDPEEKPTGPKPPALQRLKAFFLQGPFRDARFVFFIFMLLPVRTMFAHQWLTMPSYILRSFDKPVADRMEWLVNWINPGIIFIGVPILTALTRHINLYKMMVLGTLVSAAPTFLLCLGPRLDVLIVYFVVFSIGEALWSARFYEYASELAPPGRVAQFMGLAQIPWLLAKGTTGFYSGAMLARYCPENTPRNLLQTDNLFFIYGCIAMATPIGLWLARNWVMAGLHGAKTR